MSATNKLISIFSEKKSQWISSVCLVLVVFIAVLLFVNLIINGIFYSLFWPLFGLAVVVLILGVAVVRHGFCKISKKRQIVLYSIIFSIFVIVISPLFFTQGIQQMLNYANFYFIKDAYLQKISLISQTNVPRFVAFKWEGFEKQLLIFDESDELNFPDRVKSKEWWMRAKEVDGELTACYWYSIKVAEHFYRVTFHCEQPYSGSSIPPL